MPQEAGRRRKKAHQYDIVVVPLAEGEKTRKFRAGISRLILLVGLIFVFSVALTLAVLIYTPVAIYVPIPNPGLEQKYGRQIAETQQRLRELTEDVLLVKDYNQQLRKALGEGATGDSTTATGLGASLIVDERTQKVSPSQEPPAQHPAPEQVPEEYGMESTIAPAMLSLVTTGQSARAAFPLLAPTEGFVTQNFDPYRRHYGIDYASKRGTPVCAATDGHVVFAGWTYDDGNMLIISHGGGYLTVYKHNQVLLKTARAGVRRGEPIALLGTSGKTSLGPHLHFEVWKDGIPQDPNEFLLTPSKVQ